MNMIKKIHARIIHFITYRIHLKEFKLLWMYRDIDKKHFKKLLNMEILLMYDKIDYTLSKHKRIQKMIL